jgi:hypothetical protein
MIVDPVPFTIAVAVTTGLVTALGALWRRTIVSERESKARETEREKQAAQREQEREARCEREIGRAFDRIRHLEDRSHDDQNVTIGVQREMMGECLATMRETSIAIKDMVALEKTKQTASGTHPTVKG